MSILFRRLCRKNVGVCGYSQQHRTSFLCKNKQLAARGVYAYYHSYPNPEEEPKISRALSPKERIGVKEPTDLRKFSMITCYPGVPVSTGIARHDPPKTASTVLPCGMTVASQDMFGQMSSFGLLGMCFYDMTLWNPMWFYNITLWCLWYNPMVFYDITLWCLWYNPMVSTI